MPKQKPATGANRLREWRKAARLSQEDLADLVGTTPSTLSRYERGTRSLTIDLLLQLAEALECRPADLLPDPDSVLGGPERRFLAAWHQLDEGERDHLLRTAEALAEVKREREAPRLARRLA